jgi:hypothetical protein
VRKTELRQARWFALLAALLLPVVGGCDDGRPRRVPVSGKVTIDGESLTQGAVRFKPVDGRVATGEIGPDGSFTLSTYEPRDGVVTGLHAVTIHASEELDDNSIRWHVPKKYQRAGTSGLTQTIDGPRDDLLIELTWDGKPGPFVEKLPMPK